jgi:AcrR family transcriptional regulator
VADGQPAGTKQRPAAGRRTQAQRREATRTALIDAAVECLIEEGNAGLTTRKVADRAGVSQGTQMHYFPTRGVFLAEAMRHVARKLAQELKERHAVRARTEQGRFEQFLDVLWEVHTTPVFATTIELWVTARTDLEIRAAMADVERDASRLIADAAHQVIPELMATARGRELLDMGLAAMRGLALLSFTSDQAEVERRWKRARGHLLEGYEMLSVKG